MEKYASPQGSDELEQSEWIRKGLELELVMARSKLENSRSVQAGMEFVLQIERAKYQRLEEKHAKKEVMKEKLIKKIAQIEESVLKVVRSTKQGNMNPEFWELLECERARREVMQCQLLEELADAKKKWAVSEASLDVKTHHCCDLEWEKLCMQNDMLKFEKIIQESKNLSDQSKNDIHTMKCALDSKKQDVFTISQKLQEALSASEALDKPIKTLEMSLQLMESENIKLKDVAKEQANRMSVVLKEAEKATLANKDLTKQLSREVQKQTLLYIYAHGQLKQKEAILLNERQKASKAKAQQEALQERLEKVRSVGEDTLRKLQQDLADTQTKLMTCEGLLEIHAVHCSDLEEENVSMEKDVGMLKRLLQESEDSCTQSESCIRNLVAKLNEKDNEIVTSSQKLLDLSDSGNKEPALKTTEIQEHPDGEDTDGWEMVWQLQQKVANAKIDLLACKASLKVNANHCRDLEEEKQSLQKDMITLKGSLREREDMCAQSEEHIQNLIASCNEKDHQIRTFSKQLQVSSASKIKKSKKENIQDSEETDRQNTLWRLQKELADTKTKLSAREASLKVNAKHCRDLEEEKHSMQTDISALKGRVWESEDKCTQSEERVCNLTASCEDKDHQIRSLSKKLQVWSNSRSQEPDLKNTEIEEHLDNEETDTQSTVRQIQQELADTKRKLLTCEASLKVSANHCRDLEEEKQSVQNDISTLKGRLWESEDKCAQSEELTHSMMMSCAEKDHQICALSKDLQVLSASKSKKSKKGKIQDSEETDRQNVVWQLQQELADTKTKLTTFEESLKVKSEHCRELEEESQSMQTDIVTLKGRLQETENMHVQSEKHICNLMATCDDKDHQICTLSKELQVLSASVGTDKTLEQAEESLDAVSQLEAEIASMQAVAEQQTGMIAALQKEVEEAARVKKDLGELNQETKEQSSLSLKTDEQMKKRMAALQEEKEKANLQQEALQKQLEDMQNEKKVLHQQLKEAQMKEDTKEQVGTDVQNERFAKMQAHYEKKAKELEKRSKELASRYSALYGHLDSDKTDREHNWRQVKQDLADMQSKSLVDNVPLEVISRHCSNLEEKERPNMEQDLKSLEEMIKEFENCLEAVEGSG
ncbi:hypothetical protein SKAU_G00262900 [Synaphobranchus kaupii]|uniref:CCDC144C-like coiled-coil domain-containing protein n=1 Tax=Synaphobranchus kaupii TaxID=118154 RepID=A0A9Q1IPT3_SYNKA|nr:hypothetical protein SKAU_G00262900 [Synaphobranchus kaupii]